MKKLILVLALFSSLAGYGQKGFLRVKVTEESSKQAVMAALLVCQTATGGGYTDYNGVALLELPEGSHSIKLTYMGVDEVKENIAVAAGDTADLHWVMGAKVNETATVIFAAERSKKTDAAILTEQRKSTTMLDGISAQSFKKAGASTAGQAVARVPGVSVQGGKYVVVRGLGDRYSKTILNFMSIPGLDPDKNTVQLDIFPSNLLDNIVVYKTFSPELPADFAGGLVNLNTKAIPSARMQEFSFSLGYNPNMHLRKDFLGYEGGKYDDLGFDDGGRALPISKTLDLTQAKYNPVMNNPELTEITKKFSGTLAPRRQMNGLDGSASYSIGDKFVRDYGSYGMYFTLNYNKRSTFYDDAYFGTYVMDADKSVNELVANTVREGQIGKQNVRWSGLFGTAFSHGTNTIKLNLIHTQNGESTASYQRQEDFRENPSIIFKNNLEYTQRSVSNLLLAGTHSFDDEKWNIDWRLAPTLSIIDEPDIRMTAFEYTDDLEPRYEINEGVGAVATRTYRYLLEQNYNGRLDVTRKFKLKNGETSKVKFGAIETHKIRDFEILNYQFRVVQESKFTFTGNADELLMPQNIWTPTENSANDSGVYVSGNPEPANTYHAKQNVFGAYLMHEYPLTARFKATYGLRMEKANNYYTGSNQSGSVVYDNELLLDELDLLPSVNLVFGILPDRMNLRASYNQTLARPSFKELSNAQIVDRISGRTFIGNADLEQTSIRNIDLRWEYFMTQSQMISFSSFYKSFDNPIELVAYSASAPDNFQPRNVGKALVYGLEMELRKNLTSSLDTNKRIQVGMNLTLVQSQVEMTASEYEGRLMAARAGQDISMQRDMVGQSPYIVNSFVNYTGFGNGLDVSLSYNVQGARLSRVGVGRTPDVYEIPFHDLSFRINKGLTTRFTMNLGLSNILGSSRVLVYKSFDAADQIFSELYPGRRVSLGFNYAL